MPAYSFQSNFVDYILDGTKTHTIRDIRKGNSKHAKTDDPLMLYTAMRTKWCRKIGDAICLYTLPIFISRDGIWLNGEKISQWSASELAWRDGFRPHGSTIIHPMESLETMIRYWAINGALDYERRIIYWKDFKPAPPKGLIEKIKE